MTEIRPGQLWVRVKGDSTTEKKHIGQFIVTISEFRFRAAGELAWNVWTRPLGSNGHGIFYTLAKNFESGNWRLVSDCEEQ